MLFCRSRMRIGDVQLNPGALLAPMEAVTDLPFRTVCEELGVALTITEFLSAQALTRGATKAIGRMWPSLGGRRFGVQIFGREPDALARAAGDGGRRRRVARRHQHGLPGQEGRGGRLRLGADARAGACGRAGRGGAPSGPGARSR